MNAYMGYLMCQYSSLKLLELILKALMVVMFCILVITVVSCSEEFQGISFFL